MNFLSDHTDCMEYTYKVLLKQCSQNVQYALATLSTIKLETKTLVTIATLKIELVYTSLRYTLLFRLFTYSSESYYENTASRHSNKYRRQ